MNKDLAEMLQYFSKKEILEEMKHSQLGRPFNPSEKTMCGILTIVGYVGLCSGVVNVFFPDMSEKEKNRIIRNCLKKFVKDMRLK